MAFVKPTWHFSVVSGTDRCRQKTVLSSHSFVLTIKTVGVLKNDYIRLCLNHLVNVPRDNHEDDFLLVTIQMLTRPQSSSYKRRHGARRARGNGKAFSLPISPCAPTWPRFAPFWSRKKSTGSSQLESDRTASCCILLTVVLLKHDGARRGHPGARFT